MLFKLLFSRFVTYNLLLKGFKTYLIQNGSTRDAMDDLLVRLHVDGGEVLKDE